MTAPTRFTNEEASWKNDSVVAEEAAAAVANETGGHVFDGSQDAHPTSELNWAALFVGLIPVVSLILFLTSTCIMASISYGEIGVVAVQEQGDEDEERQEHTSRRRRPLSTAKRKNFLLYYFSCEWCNRQDDSPSRRRERARIRRASKGKVLLVRHDAEGGGAGSSIVTTASEAVASTIASASSSFGGLAAGGRFHFDPGTRVLEGVQASLPPILEVDASSEEEEDGQNV